MPTYEYRCDACEYTFDHFQSITARSLKTCPKCKRRSLQRLIGSGAGIIFKGSGFYQTDYRSESYKKGAEAEKKGTSSDSAEKPAKTAEPAATKTPTSKKPGKKSGSGAEKAG